jgi:S1-C subfamily serine protease
MKKVLAICLLTVIMSLFSFAKDNKIPNMLEKAIQGVVTVVVFDTEELGTLYAEAKEELGESSNMGFGVASGVKPGKIAYENVNLFSSSQAVSCGSGFVIKKEGEFYIVTNAHVIDNAKPGELYVYNYKGDMFEVAVKGADTFWDIAVLEFTETDDISKEFIILDFFKGDVRAGEKVYAIGNPLGDFPYTISDGIISAISRQTEQTLTSKFGYLQTTTTITHGNSGGPLVDEDGKVVGINTYTMQENLGTPQFNFAVDINNVKEKIYRIIDGKDLRCYLGVILKQEENRNAFLSDKFPELLSVVPNSIAENKLSSYIGWNIIELNGVEIKSLNKAYYLLENILPGKDVTLVLKKDNKEEKITLRTSEFTEQNLLNSTHYFLDKIGLLISSKNDRISIGFMNNFNKRDFNYFNINFDVYSISNENEFEYMLVNKSETEKYGSSIEINLGVIDGNFYQINTDIDIANLIRISLINGSINFMNSSERSFMPYFNYENIVESDDLRKLKLNGYDVAKEIENWNLEISHLELPSKSIFSKAKYLIY